MNIILVGAGSETSKLNLALSEQKHAIQAQLAMFAANHLEMFDFKLLIVVSPEASVQIETLVHCAEKGKMIFIVAGASDGLAAWAAGAGVPTFSYPITGVDLDQMCTEVRRAEAGGIDEGDHYRKIVLGGDIAARIQGQMNARKIVVTSPKGGTGKTTISVNLATALALSGVTTYLVDADANAGALQYHLRLRSIHTTLIGLLRRMAETPVKPSDDPFAMGGIASAGKYLSAFTQISELPTLKVLPGLVTDDLGDKALQDEQVIGNTIQGVFEAGVASGGVVIMDVGINPSHPVHRAALRNAEAIAIVIKPEIPDLAETRRWVSRMIASLASQVGKTAAIEFIGSRVKLCYNMVVGGEFKRAHETLMSAFRDDELDLKLPPNGIIPVVNPHLAAHAVNSDHIEDILVWRYKEEHLEELEMFTQQLIGFAQHFVPAVEQGASRVGLMPGSFKKKGFKLGKR
jgi:MinD-like ATPase involved in chromosome partitioning or flagellar assembly